ncbi:MAG: ABC transporter permease [Clostridiales bacterium]|jgi:simple sugar transport system permease protein|nr:ABC transporter permease [Clostridiales bacterium]
MPSLVDMLLNPSFWFSVLRVTTPIIFAAIAALITDKAGIMNISMEGTMLFSALAGTIVSALTQSAWIGLLGAMAAGVLLSLTLAYFTLELKTDVILGGVAINLFADGGSIFILYLLTGDKGTSVSLASKVLPSVTIPLIDKIPVLGAIISGHNALTYIAAATVFAVYFMLKSTPLGLKIRAVGENSSAAQSVGVSAKKIQYLSLALSGLIASLGGAYMSMAYLPNFSRNMTSGRGWIALAAEAMGQGGVLATSAASLVFGFADAMANALQMFSLPAELVGIIPYVATVIGLILYSVRIKNANKRRSASKKPL